MSQLTQTPKLPVKHAVAVVAAVLPLACTVLMPLPAHAQDLPTRRPGLWSISMKTDGAIAQSARHCVDASTDKQMQQMSRGMAGNCKNLSQSMQGSALVMEQECTIGKTNIATRSVITGDFHSTVRTDVTSKYSPALAGKTTGRTLIEATWTGACPNGWKPGDMELPGGAKMNVNQVLSGAGKASKN